jgi:L-aminopeptidase/D-esterase-like protein
VIPGVRVGHATDCIGLTGVTVVLPDRPAVGGVDVRGRAAGVHGLEFLEPRHLVPTVDGVVLAGGSAFGLESIWGVMQWLEEHDIGFRTRHAVVPHVAGAIVYDLGVGDSRARPDRAMGYAAAAAAAHGSVTQGNVGAGTGATVGKLWGATRAMRGGLGAAATDLDGATLAALVAVNAVGDVRDPSTGELIAGTRDAPDGRRLIDTAAALAAGAPLPSFQPVNTTIGVVVTTAALSKAEATRLARAAMDGLGLALSPPHLDTDGDTLFCLSVGNTRGDPDTLARAAADVVARAIVNAARTATSLPGLPASRDLSGC